MGTWHGKSFHIFHFNINKQCKLGYSKKNKLGGGRGVEDKEFPGVSKK